MKRGTVALAVLAVLIGVGAALAAVPNATVSEITPDSLKLTGLKCNQDYRIRLWERNANGKFPSNYQQFLKTTQACPPPPTSTTTTTPTTSTTTTQPTTTTTTTTPPPPADEWPNPSNTGTPPGWTPTSTRTTTLHVTTAGAVVEDIRFVNASISVEAPNVTIRRVQIQGGDITNYANVCAPGMVVEDSTIEPAPGSDHGNDSEAVISYGGYSVDGVKIVNRSEGFRSSTCGPVSISNSFAKITPPQPCGDWHGDGIQGYGGGALTVRNVTIDMRTSGCYGTSPFFYPANQGNTSADVDRLLVMGQGYSFRDGMPGQVSNLKIVDGSWIFGPIDVKCSVLAHWDADIVTIDANYQPTTVRSQPCNTNSGT